MDDFNVYWNHFDQCLEYLEQVLQRCVEKNLLLNYEKCHFMVKEEIVLGHIISKKWNSGGSSQGGSHRQTAISHQ